MDKYVKTVVAIFEQHIGNTAVTPSLDNQFDIKVKEARKRIP